MNVSCTQRSLRGNSQTLHGRTCRRCFSFRKPYVDRHRGPLVSKVSKEQRDSTTHIPSALSNDGVVSTTGKLTLAAFLGGALVKYGSLYSDLPFNPSPVAAVLIVLSPPVGFCIWAALQDDSTDDLS